MREIKELVESIDEELESAEHYAEKYVEAMLNNNTVKATKFKAITSDELNHCLILHEMAIAGIDAARKITAPSSEMLKKWDEEHAKYIEKMSKLQEIIGLKS